MNEDSGKPTFSITKISEPVPCEWVEPDVTISAELMGDVYVNGSTALQSVEKILGWRPSKVEYDIYKDAYLIWR